jgi:hypothetical protein
MVWQEFIFTISQKKKEFIFTKETMDLSPFHQLSLNMLFISSLVRDENQCCEFTYKFVFIWQLVLVKI